MKELRDEQNGVRWSSEQVSSVNVIHYMEFNQRTLSGGWVGPSLVFRALVEMTEEERAAMVSIDHDGCMGRIRMKIEQFKRESRHSPLVEVRAMKERLVNYNRGEFL